MPTKSASPGRRGRPPKFGRPSQVVALTLPDEVLRGLRKVHPDLGWAIVTLFEKTPDKQATPPEPLPEAQLVKVSARRSLIAVNRAIIKTLPGINLIPLDGERAFLALEPGHGMADLELAIVDRLEDETVEAPERQALKRLRAQLRAWRRNPVLRFHPRAIIVVEQASRRPRRPRT